MGAPPADPVPALVNSRWERLDRLLPVSAGAARLDLAGNELVARDLRNVVEILENLPQFAAELGPAVGQVRRRFQQILVGHDLARGHEQ